MGRRVKRGLRASDFGDNPSPKYRNLDAAFYNKNEPWERAAKKRKRGKK